MASSAKKAYEAYELPVDYWLEVLTAAHSAFWDFVRSDADDADLKDVLDQFGKDGDQADFRLLFCDPFVLVPTGQGNSKFKPFPLVREKHGISSEEFHAISLKVCRLQVESFLGNPALLQRYYEAVLWSGWLRFDDIVILARAADGTREGFESGPADDYWWYARNFLLLACATDRMDVLRGAEASLLKERFDSWYTWLYSTQESGKRLNFDTGRLIWSLHVAPWARLRSDQLFPNTKRELPIKPFDDWKGPPPPLRQAITHWASLHLVY